MIKPLWARTLPVESSGVHGRLRAGFSEVGPEVVIILTPGLDDLLLLLLSWINMRTKKRCFWNQRLRQHGSKCKTTIRSTSGELACRSIPLLWKFYHVSFCSRNKTREPVHKRRIPFSNDSGGTLPTHFTEAWDCLAKRTGDYIWQPSEGQRNGQLRQQEKEGPLKANTFKSSPSSGPNKNNYWGEPAYRAQS